jgi:hypothetical protein
VGGRHQPAAAKDDQKTSSPISGFWSRAKQIGD